MSNLETAARALIAGWENRMSGEREQLKEYDGHEYWSPSAAAVSSERIAALRVSLSAHPHPVEMVQADVQPVAFDTRPSHLDLASANYRAKDAERRAETAEASLAACQMEKEALREALTPFARISTEGIAKLTTNYTEVRMLSDYFHTAARVLSAIKKGKV